MSRIFSTFRAQKNRTFLKIWLIYVALVALIYLVLPLTFELNWLDFFDPVQNGYLPYIDFHVGYPPLGFLPFMSFALISNFDPSIYSTLMRTTCAIFLILSVWLVYSIAYKVHGRRDAFLSAFLTMGSFSILSYSRHSNEPIALFFALLSVYFMLDKKALSTGVAIGLGAMVKIIPGLLIFPAIKRLEFKRDRVLLFGAVYTVFLLLNIAFIIPSPFMWLGTYLYNGARGPWETVWALAEGWYGHGGSEILHPYFEVFIPYSQLAAIYPPSPYDTAFYAWNAPWLPTILTILGFASLLLSYMLMNEHDVLEGVGLTLFLFMFFSKGYSPQFSVFMLPFIALVFVGSKKIGLFLMLEVATIIQSIVWTLGFYSPPLLALSVILRTITFILIIAALTMSLIRRRMATGFLSVKIPRIGKLKDKFLVIFVISISIAAGSAYFLNAHYRQFPLTVDSQIGTIDLKLHQTAFVSLPNLAKNERVLFNLKSNSNISVVVKFGQESIWITESPNVNVKNLFVAREPGNYSLAVDSTTENTSEVTYKIYFVSMYSLPNSPSLYFLYSTLIIGTTTAWISLFKRFKEIKT